MFLKRIAKLDRRRSQRRWLSTSVDVLSGSVTMNGLSVNLSDQGMCLFLMANLPIGSQIEVGFFVPRAQAPVRISAVVRYRVLYLYGIEFLGATQSSEAGLNREVVHLG